MCRARLDWNQGGCVDLDDVWVADPPTPTELSGYTSQSNPCALKHKPSLTQSKPTPRGQIYPPRGRSPSIQETMGPRTEPDSSRGRILLTSPTTNTKLRQS
ncbi:hypothetical protein PGT21_002091 [Puccinia graminis f. sp. tritici]|uniref:Uncharacterized protein n=1 Tax=Puccinia graminis f. sp. tritici TaxID=56615 RepID=A0A5B0Q9K2_PUCGR|nr:hypothetical protein PGT21_002091 [Puccinia graminis f. sp. tritici]